MLLKICQKNDQKKGTIFLAIGFILIFISTAIVRGLDFNESITCFINGFGYSWIGLGAIFYFKYHRQKYKGEKNVA